MKTLAYLIPSTAAFIQHHLPLAQEAAKSYRVHLIAPEDPALDPGVLASAGITPHWLTLTRKSGNPARVLGEAEQVRRLLKRLRPDLVNAINLKAVLLAALANLGSATPLVGTIPGLGYLFSGNTLRQRLLRNATQLTLRNALSRQRHRLILSNPDDAAEFLKRRVTRQECLRVIPVPGVDTAAFLPSPEPVRGYRVVLPARMLREKGVAVFVEAARRLAGELPGAEFILAGEPDPGNPSSLSREQLAAWKREGRVSWLGHCPDMPGLLASCHVVCLPSTYREGVPRVLLEAMSSGRAIVTTDTPGCRDVGRGAGVIISPGNPEALVEALRRLYREPEERRAMGRAGRAKVEAKFMIQSINQEMLACYRECLETGY